MRHLPRLPIVPGLPIWAIRLLLRPWFLCAAGLALMVGAASAQTATATEGNGTQQFGDIGDLKLVNGQVLRACRVGYRAFGRLDASKSNVVLFPTWFGGSAANLADLIGPGKLIDSSRYYVIAVDALANGVSTSPSNSPTQPRLRFPEIGIRDMVASQHALLTKVLHIPHVRAVMGISMGGMQTFQWILAHPTFMDRAVAIAGSPQLAPYDLLLWQSELDAIFSDPEWKGGDYTKQPLLRAVQEIQDLALTTPEHYNRVNTRQTFLAGIAKRVPPTLDANDRVRQLQAMVHHDVAAPAATPFGGSLAKAAAQVKASLLVVVEPRDHMVTPGPALEFAAAARARVLKTDTDCGHLAPSCEGEAIGAAISEHLADPGRATTRPGAERSK
ncbi:MAG: alpha/beta fold hydrolase [Myxococcales bacterium]